MWPLPEKGEGQGSKRGWGMNWRNIRDGTMYCINLQCSNVTSHVPVTLLWDTAAFMYPEDIQCDKCEEYLVTEEEFTDDHKERINTIVLSR